MQLAISLFRAIKPSQIIIAIALQIVICLGLSFLSVNPSQAWAALTPEANSYQVDNTAEDVRVNTKAIGERSGNAVDDTKQSLEDARENVVEKLNLNESLPPETKQFFRQIQGKEPIENYNER